MSKRKGICELRSTRDEPKKILVLYLIKVVPAFALVFFVWRVGGLAGLYYSLVAAPLDVFYSKVNVAPWVQRVSVDAENIVFSTWVNGKVIDLSLHADYMTGNIVLLAVLFLASPIKPFVGRYIIHFVSALMILFGIHVFTVAVGAQLAFTSIPALSTNVSGIKILYRYIRFYELIGMYLFVVLLWLPYVGGYLIRVSRCRGPDAGSS